MNNEQKVLLYGFGKRFFENLEQIEKKYKIVAIADSDYRKQGKYERYDIISPLEISEYSFDKIIITPREFQGILIVLQALGIPNEQIELLVSEKEYGHVWSNVSMVPKYRGGVECKFDNICFYIKSNSDYMVMDDIFKKNGWDFYCNEKVVVVDIGMNIGLASLYFANMENVEFVYGYEPFLETYQQAINNFAQNSQEIQDKLRPENCGLTDHEGKAEVLYDSLYTTNMRVDQGKRLHGESEERVEIQLLSAASVVRRIKEKHCNRKIIMKIDCEGSEYLIFEELVKSDILKDVYMILMETHDGRENEIKQHLKNNGFLYFDNYLGGFPQLGYLYAVNRNIKNEY